MDLAAIRSFVAANLTVAGFTAYGSLVDGVELPALVLRQPKHIRYVDTYEGRATVDIALSILVPLADVASAQQLIDRALSTGDGSVVVALWALDELAGRPWTSLAVTDVDEPGTTTLGNAAVIQADMALTFKARHS